MNENNKITSMLALLMSPMEHVLSTEYIKEMILDQVTYNELNNLRCCSKSLQQIVSDYSEYKMKPYITITWAIPFNKKFS